MNGLKLYSACYSGKLDWGQQLRSKGQRRVNQQDNGDAEEVHMQSHAINIASIHPAAMQAQL